MRRSAFTETNKLGGFIKRISAQENKIRFLRYRFRWNYLPRFHVVSKFPTHVDIETTNKCNLRCAMCPHGFPTPDFKKSLGSMDVDLAEKIIDEGCRKGLSSIKINWRGEPLLWKEHIPQIIKYAKERGIIDVIMNTNGLQLDHSLSYEIVKSGLDQIIFSIDGNSAETYSDIRIGGNFDKLVKNIENLLKIKRSLKLEKPLVRVQMVRMDSNIHETDRFRDRWLPLVDSVTFQDYTNRGEQSERMPLDTGELEKVGRRPCPQIWQRIVVTWDGKVVMCCRDWEAENVIGKLNYSKGIDLEFFWKGPELNCIRRLHMEKISTE